MFRPVPLSIIRSFSLCTQQYYMSYRFADSLLASKAPDNGQRNCPKHIEFYSQKQIWEISASSWFCYKNVSRVPSWSCSQAVSKPVWHIPLLCVRWKTPDDGQRNCPKHVEFYSKNKFDEFVHLVGFIIWIYHDERSPARPITLVLFVTLATCSCIPTALLGEI